MKHPNEEQNKNQETFLAQLPESNRKLHQMLFSTGNAAFCYHLETQKEIIPTRLDFEDWLEGLAPDVKKEMKQKGFEKCKKMLSFTRHVMERNNIGMTEWMKQHLTVEEFEFWQNQGGGGKVSPS